MCSSRWWLALFSQAVSSSLHELGHLLTHLRGVTHNVDSCVFKGSNLVSSASLATGDDCTGVTHTTAWRGSLASDEADNGQVTVVVGTEPLSSFLLGLATDLTDHDDSFGFRIVDKLGKDIDKVGTIERITTNTDNS